MTIRILNKQGRSIRAISRELGISRNTVRKYLRSESDPGYRQRVRRPSKLDPFKRYIESRVQAAAPDWIPGTVIYREILALGFTGKQRIVNGYLQSLKPQSKPDPVVRFETPMGQQMQVDWGVFRRGKQPLSAFVATLGYSRYSYVEFVQNEQFGTLRQCHLNAFEYFQGVPHQILYDNMKTVVLARNAYGAGLHRFHAGLWDFAKAQGFHPRLCRPYRAKTKGKVERFIRYLRESFYVPLRASLTQSGLEMDVATANSAVRVWLRTVANIRHHGTTHERPYDRWQQERAVLQTLQSYISKPISESALPTATTVATELPQACFQHPLSTYDQLIEVQP